jgi:hypothetical protein
VRGSARREVLRAVAAPGAGRVVGRFFHGDEPLEHVAELVPEREAARAEHQHPVRVLKPRARLAPQARAPRVEHAELRHALVRGARALDDAHGLAQLARALEALRDVLELARRAHDGEHRVAVDRRLPVDDGHVLQALHRRQAQLVAVLDRDHEGLGRLEAARRERRRRDELREAVELLDRPQLDAP